MATVNLSRVSIPMVDASFYASQAVPANRQALAQIEAQYGQPIKLAATLTRVPEALIKGFLFIESRGEPRALSRAGAVGLMQLLPATATMVLALENIKKRLGAEEAAILRQTLGPRLDCILRMRNLGTEVKCGGIAKNAFVTREDLYVPAFNILVGTIFLGILLDEHKEGETLRLDKVVVRYNRGYFAERKGAAMVGPPKQVLAKFTGETADFIKKLVGVNGILLLT